MRETRLAGIRQRVLSAVFVAAIALSAAAACSGPSDSSDGAPPSGVLTIGLLVPQSGPYKINGPEIVDGFQLYLDTHGGMLGGHGVKIVVADEGDGRQTAANSAKKLIEQDRVSVIVGSTTDDSTLSLQPMVNAADMAFVGTGGRPSTLKDTGHIWHASWLSREPGAAIADHIRTSVDGPVYVIGPDFQGGYDNIGGFVDAFTTTGGKLANEGGKPTWTPWPAQSTNFTPYLNKISPSGAKAVFACYAGPSAVEFVKQYAQVGLRGKIPLFGSGFLTDESVLNDEGGDADGVWTSLNYAADLDNATNRAFVTEFTKRHSTPPHLMHVTAYDAAMVLDKAITAAGKRPTRASINAAIGTIGAVESPRGAWRWSTDHTPVQTWYLRKVTIDGRGRANVVVKSLTTLGKSQ